MKIEKNKNNKPLLIIDTDPGHDDALALLMTLNSNLFDIRAITTVAGNATIENVTRNAQAIVNLTQEKVPIYSGKKQPIKRKLVTAVVHGESGLAGFDTSTTQYTLSNNAPEKIIEIVKHNPKKVTILALGPLSNIARAITKDPTIIPLIKELVIMGGAIDVPGNKNRVAEFNFFVDPEAAKIVFEANIPKVLVPLDACNQVVLQVSDFEKIQNKSLSKILVPMMEHFVESLISDEGTNGILVYDALAAFFLMQPDAFKLKAMNIVIETQGIYTSGMSVAEKRAHKVDNTNVRVVTRIDAESFKKTLFSNLSK